MVGKDKSSHWRECPRFGPWKQRKPLQWLNSRKFRALQNVGSNLENTTFCIAGKNRSALPRDFPAMQYVVFVRQFETTVASKPVGTPGIRAMQSPIASIRSALRAFVGITADITGHGESTIHCKKRRKPCSRACHGSPRFPPIPRTTLSAVLIHGCVGSGVSNIPPSYTVNPECNWLRVPKTCSIADSSE
ncbi:hypothetical protein Poly51_55750 [Rubripirellula tenax]|uniref:Uncharacterized protein n=1 Tax=Rubripirellula tenax TaxID=2528015 RepID=A0A5C6EBS5_9BACT|nr:hypothetical protein Poly51_55750 [Rubripirellula tenax]